MVRCIPVTLVTSNDGEGGRKILGLSTAWTVYQRAAKVIEFGLIGTHKASQIYLLILSCAEMITAVHIGSLGFDCSLASRSATNEETIPIHYYQIWRNWLVIELPLRRRRRNPEESYRAITITRESYFNSESSGIADTGEETSGSSPTLTSQQGWECFGV